MAWLVDGRIRRLAPHARLWRDPAYRAAFMEPGPDSVAHRMSATLQAKRVLVMDGNGIDVGRHDELLQRHALYADFHGLWGNVA